MGAAAELTGALSPGWGAGRPATALQPVSPAHQPPAPASPAGAAMTHALRPAPHAGRPSDFPAFDLLFLSVAVSRVDLTNPGA
ncbi:hypothetical protein GCM10011589_45200 [Modestobacter marinus]|uniref:Uncharacterized protein n=1 Tax=Modestobacter marinus TaxID=477641 RepID=A0ABQ2GBZ5_9ACTN|nr:hypothetical protein GCM10011589_45200 [Modestobacter marinus]